MTDRTTVEMKARALAEFEMHSAALDMGNTAGLSPAERIEASAKAMIARDRVAEARAAYRRAFDLWQANGFRD